MAPEEFLDRPSCATSTIWVEARCAGAPSVAYYRRFLGIAQSLDRASRALDRAEAGVRGAESWDWTDPTTICDYFVLVDDIEQSLRASMVSLASLRGALVMAALRWRISPLLPRQLHQFERVLRRTNRERRAQWSEVSRIIATPATAVRRAAENESVIRGGHLTTESDSLSLDECRLSLVDAYSFVVSTWRLICSEPSYSERFRRHARGLARRFPMARVFRRRNQG